MTNVYTAKKREFTCRKCSWRGLGATLVLLDYYDSGVAEMGCPSCQQKVALFSSPDLIDVQQAAVGGDEEAIKALPSYAAHANRLERWRAMAAVPLADPEKLSSGPVMARMRLADADGETWCVLEANGHELHRELAIYNSTEPATRLFGQLLDRYGERLRGFDYSAASGYLCGDTLSASRVLEDLVARLPKG